MKLFKIHHMKQVGVKHHAPWISDELSLLEIARCTDYVDWTHDQFDKISEMKIGEKLNFDGVTVERDA